MQWLPPAVAMRNGTSRDYRRLAIRRGGRIHVVELRAPFSVASEMRRSLITVRFAMRLGCVGRRRLGPQVGGGLGGAVSGAS